jgi:Zn-dependent M16 (insulinase) family peptidase
VDNVVGPLVNGYFAVATEAADDRGLPHCLEHLVFMGSQSYPYPGTELSVTTDTLI